MKFEFIIDKAVASLSARLPLYIDGSYLYPTSSEKLVALVLLLFVFLIFSKIASLPLAEFLPESECKGTAFFRTTKSFPRKILLKSIFFASS